MFWVYLDLDFRTMSNFYWILDIGIRGTEAWSPVPPGAHIALSLFWVCPGDFP